MEKWHIINATLLTTGNVYGMMNKIEIGDNLV